MSFNLLSVDLTFLTTVISWVSIGVLAIVVILLCLLSKKLTTKTLVLAGICLALSFGLSLLKVSPVTNGGSVTLASMMPIMVFAAFYGFFPSVLVGIIFGLLQFVSGPWILTPLTFVLDYILAFASIGAVGLVKDLTDTNKALFIGAPIAYLVRFLFHFASGIIYFNMGAVGAELPTSTAVGYSFLYQVLYLVPDFIITYGVIIALLKTNTVKRLEAISNR